MPRFVRSRCREIRNLSRRAHSAGFFAPERWARREDGSRTHEISLNPDTFDWRQPREVASTLVHEMVHLWQESFGKRSRAGYHNREWADKMEEVGLMPSSTGAPGGQRVGQHMTHYILEGGPFARAFARMPTLEAALPWASGGGTGLAKPPKKRDPSKVKYSCLGCGVNVWGKLGLRLQCEDCELSLSCDEAPKSPGEATRRAA